MTKCEIVIFKENQGNLVISYGFHTTPFGKCLIGTATKSICHLSFVDDTETSAIKILQNECPQAQLKEERQNTGVIIRSIFDEDDEICKKTFHLLVKGTDLQIKVWQALISIPKGI